MGLLNSGLMPGEWEASNPNFNGGFGGNAKMQGLLSNPMFQMGLGILANNNTQNTAQVLGRGALMGVNNLQQQQRYDEDRKYRESQQKRYEREDKKYDAEEATHNEFDTKFPEYKGLSRLNPAAAIKIAYPNASSNTADPYFSDRYIGGKIYSYNHRTGEYLEKDLGGSGLPNKDDPQVQFPVAAAKSAGQGLYEPTDMRDGFIMPKSVLAVESGAPPMNFLPPQSLPQMPNQQPNQLPYNIMADPSSSPEELAKLQEVAAADYAKNGAGFAQQPTRRPAPQNYQTPVSNGGIKIPTKAEQAAAEAQAKANVELNMSPQIKAAQMGAESQAKKDATMSGIGQIIDQARGLLTGKQKPTSSKFGNIADAVGASVGFSPEGAAEADALKAVGGALVAKMPRMEGPQSNFDVANYEKMAGNVADPTLPIERRLAALNEVEKLWRKYDKTDGNILPKDAKMPQALPAKPSAMTLKKGTVYQTPKGALRWNGKAFED
jgi:hypothetical protein